ncbi:barstar family protein [Streptomyces sp. LN590]|uniref:barstar family protein n=1 Tax=unclassified Streptomyces TaxID=2593676 RepID=UPI00370F7D57
MITIDVGSVEDERQLHELLARELGFPSFYGRNWDAFWDAVTGLAEIPGRLRLVGWAHLSESVPRGAAMLAYQLDQYRCEYRPDLKVEFDGLAGSETCAWESLIA